MLRPKTTALLTALALLLAPATAFADPHTEHLDALQAELADRLANDFDGALDKPAKKQLKAVEKALSFMAKESDSAADDLKALDKGTKKLAKAYASEFDPTSIDQTLSGLVYGAVLGLRDDAVERRQELQYLVPTLSPANVAKKVGVLHDKAAAELGKYVAEETPLGRIKITSKATKFLDKAFAKAAKDNGEGVYLVYGTGGTPIVTVEPFAEWNDTTDELQVFGQYTNPVSGTVASVAVIMEGVTGPGSYPFTGDGWSGFYEAGNFNPTRYDIVEGSGALVFDELDIAGSVVRGSFAFEAYNDGNMVTLSFPEGAFRLTTIYQ